MERTDYMTCGMYYVSLLRRFVRIRQSKADRDPSFLSRLVPVVICSSATTPFRSIRHTSPSAIATSRTNGRLSTNSAYARPAVARRLHA